MHVRAQKIKICYWGIKFCLYYHKIKLQYRGVEIVKKYTRMDINERENTLDVRIRNHTPLI